MDGREQDKKKKEVLEVVGLCTVAIIPGFDSKYRSPVPPRSLSVCVCVCPCEHCRLKVRSKAMVLAGGEGHHYPRAADAREK